MILIDAANVVGSRPTGWWRDRPKAAHDLVEQLIQAVESNRLEAPIVTVLEGGARAGYEEGIFGGVQVVHAPSGGDDQLVALAKESEGTVTAVTADRELRRRLGDAGAEVRGPSWLLDRLAAK